MGLYDILLAKSLAGSGGGGGGGSSDLTTATVTVVGNVEMCLPACFDLSQIPGAPYPGYISTLQQTYGDGAYDVALFKGYALVRIQEYEDVSVSGDIQQINEDMYLLNGDCTITFV